MISYDEIMTRRGGHMGNTTKRSVDCKGCGGECRPMIRGGRRDGAGRPATLENPIRVTVSLTAATLAELDARAERMGLNRSAALRLMLETKVR